MPGMGGFNMGNLGAMPGMAGLGGMPGMGGMGGMPNVDPNQLNAMMSNPMYMNMMSEVILIKMTLFLLKSLDAK